MPGIGPAPVRSMAMKDVCDLQPRATHGRPAKPPVAASPRSIVRAGRVGWLRSGSWYWRRGCKVLWCRAWHDPEASESREYRHLARGGACEAVPQRVRRHALLDPRGLGGSTDGAAELTGRQRLDRVAAGKQPASRQQLAAPPPFPPPDAQQFEQLRRQHRVAVPRLRGGRLLRPLPCATRSSMRSESISPTLSATTSETRSPAPYAVANAALYFGPDAARSSSVTSSTLNTAGIRRGCGTTVSRRARSGRSSVTVKKNAGPRPRC